MQGFEKWYRALSKDQASDLAVTVADLFTDVLGESALEQFPEVMHVDGNDFALPSYGVWHPERTYSEEDHQELYEGDSASEADIHEQGLTAVSVVGNHKRGAPPTRCHLSYIEANYNHCSNGLPSSHELFPSLTSFTSRELRCITTSRDPKSHPQEPNLLD